MQPEDSITRIIASSLGKTEQLAELEKFRRSITVMFTDIKGSTEYFEKYGDAAGIMMVHQCNIILREIVERHAGKFIKTIGDAIMATFDEVKHSAVAAVEMQTALAEVNAGKAEQERISIRVGLNYGTGIVKSGDVFGDVVNVASRVQSVALPDQIVISDSVNRQISPLQLFQTCYLGGYVLKGKEAKHDLFALVWNQQAAPGAISARTIVISDCKGFLVEPVFKLMRVPRGGGEGPTTPLRQGELSIGRSEGDLTFPGDAQLAPRHARFYVEAGRLLVKDLSDGQGVFLKLVGTHTLQSGDVVSMGKHLLRFSEKPGVLAAAAATGTTMLDLARILDEPVAEFIEVSDRDAKPARFPLLEALVSFGRVKGTYIFPEDGLMSAAHARGTRAARILCWKT